tara:strand:- start:199 stop:576 length:378 start_codon:yes stop_codon:yes gene_type:complete
MDLILGLDYLGNRTIFSDSKKSTQKRHIVLDIERRPPLLKHAHHHHVVENTTTTTTNDDDDDEKETKNARRVPTLHADEPAVGSVPHRAIPFHRIFLSRRENDREPICRRAGHERVRQERRNDRE